MMKKFAAILLCVCLMSSLYGCSEPTCNHDYAEASCTSGPKCKYCGVVEGSPLSHTWEDATCKDPKKCSVCGATEGTPDDTLHLWKQPTCVKPKTCAVCEKTEGTTTSHRYTNGYCARCNAKEPIRTIDRDDVLPGEPEWLLFGMNSAGGISFSWKHNYTGNKKINYIKITYTLYDSVGNPVKDDIKNLATHTAKIAGPFNVGEPVKFISGVAVYCDVCHKVTFDKIVFEYADGSSEQFEYGWGSNVLS